MQGKGLLVDIAVAALLFGLLECLRCRHPHRSDRAVVSVTASLLGFPPSSLGGDCGEQGGESAGPANCRHGPQTALPRMASLRRFPQDLSSPNDTFRHG